MADRRANYALVEFQEYLAHDEDTLAVPWAEFVGDATDTHEFDVPTDDVASPFIQLQAYEVGEFGHEIVVNGEALSGFDIPPADGWQCWMDALAGVELVEGTNTVRIERDPGTGDAFVVGVATIHWKEPID